MTVILSELIKRAFTTKNGSLIKLRNENGEWDWQAFWSLVIRMVLLFLAGGIAKYFGLL